MMTLDELFSGKEGHYFRLYVEGKIPFHIAWQLIPGVGECPPPPSKKSVKQKKAAR